MSLLERTGTIWGRTAGLDEHKADTVASSTQNAANRASAQLSTGRNGEPASSVRRPFGRAVDFPRFGGRLMTRILARVETLTPLHFKAARRLVMVQDWPWLGSAGRATTRVLTAPDPARAPLGIRVSGRMVVTSTGRDVDTSVLCSVQLAPTKGPVGWMTANLAFTPDNGDGTRLSLTVVAQGRSPEASDTRAAEHHAKTLATAAAEAMRERAGVDGVAQDSRRQAGG